MIKESIDDLFNAIKNSNSYKEYINITNVLKKDTEVNKLVDEIKELQKLSVNLEYKGDNSRDTNGTRFTTRTMS